MYMLGLKLRHCKLKNWKVIHMGFGDSGLFSLRSILSEMGVINGNIVGSNRNAYKASTYSYGGGVINGSLQTPDQSLITSHTSIDFSQGEIVGTGQQTDFAIAGEGFFLLQQIQDVGGPNSANLLTRDGSFQFTDVPALGGRVLTTNNGLAVLRDNGAGSFDAILESDFKNNGFRPSIVMPSNGVDSLIFSNKGSSVYEFTGGVIKGDGVLHQSSIETSNADIKEGLLAMQASSKKFAAMACQLKNEQTNLEVVLGLIK
jgi:flagellar hook protein FlgE